MSSAAQAQWSPEPPAELLSTTLRRLGEGVGKVVYASEHWVIKRERSPAEVVAIILLWNALRKLKRVFPHGWIDRLLQGPSHEIRLLRILVQSAMLFIPKSLWFTQNIRRTFRTYLSRDVRGERLAQQHLEGSGFVPKSVQFPPTPVKISGWPGKLTVSSATERVEGTLHQHLSKLAAEGRFGEIEEWLNRLLSLRRSGWSHGLFSMDAHLKNFGVCGERVVLLDTGGLTNRWSEIMNTLQFEEQVVEPHRRLGLREILKARPDIAARFDQAWKSVVNPETVREHWPAD